MRKSESESEREPLWFFQVEVETGSRRTDVKMEGSGKEEGEEQGEREVEAGRGGGVRRVSD